ncbi:MAG: LacI family DNA-binding transcriptional regulator [Candidatus Saganbacteria bacterium]|nr:LacI family DNA-binding transcriptional regulator [Candidatus Saganbacteria bacterium]
MSKRRKKVNIKDVARALNISYATVSQALNHPREVNRKTVQSVIEKCRELEYHKNIPRKKRKGVIGVIAQDIYNLVLGEYYTHVLVGVLEEVQKLNIRLEVEFLSEGNSPLMISKNSVDGVLLFGKIKKELVQHLRQNEIPMILVGHPIPHIELHTVMPDGRAGMYSLTKHLLDLGHRKIALVYSSPLRDYITADRIAGYRCALTEYRIKLTDKYLIEANWCHPESSYEATCSFLKLNKANRPTAIIYMNDTMAYRAYSAFTERKIRIPQDISIAGFDDLVIPNYIEPFKPTLTTVKVDQGLLGKTAVDLLLNLTEKPSKISLRYTLPVELKIKGSTGPVNAK